MAADVRRVAPRVGRVKDITRARDAAVSTASDLDLTVHDALVLHDSDKLTLRLLPCDVVVRIAHVGHEVARFEVELAQRLAETESMRIMTFSR
jgi:hypothetical protein